MSFRHLATGSPLPAVNPDVLRIYSMHFCPFAERTRLVLAHKNIPHEVVNVNLKRKPEWLFDRNPLGLVPTLEYKGHYICESAICDEFLEDAFPASAKLLPSDAFQRAATKLFMALSDKWVLKIYGVYRAQTPEKRQEAEAEWMKSLQEFENHLVQTGAKFFGGAQVGMADLHVWPFFERTPAIRAIFGIDMLPSAQFPRLAEWFAAMENIEAVVKCRISNDLHRRFIESYVSGGEPEYDLAVE